MGSVNNDCTVKQDDESEFCPCIVAFYFIVIQSKFCHILYLLSFLLCITIFIIYYPATSASSVLEPFVPIITVTLTQKR